MSNPRKLDGLNAFLYSVTCEGDHLEEPSVTNKIFLRYQDHEGQAKVTVADADGYTELVNCSDENTGQVKGVQAACSWNDRVWSSVEHGDAGTHQELRFLSGRTNGEIQITHFVDGKRAWTAGGTHSCSNGISICRFQLPLVAGGIAGNQEVGVTYEQFTDSDGDEFIVVGAFGEEIAISEKYRELPAGAKGGLRAQWSDDPTFDIYPTSALPRNVYKATECRK